MTGTVGIAGDRICSFVERIEHIDEEIKALNDGKKEGGFLRSQRRRF